MMERAHDEKNSKEQGFMDGAWGEGDGGMMRACLSWY